MNKKILTPEEFPKKFKPKERLTYSIGTPFDSISISSEKTL